MGKGRGSDPKQRPAPMTVADCNLQDFPFMPLHVSRLRDSDLAATFPAETCWFAVMLWAASWHQSPAASLPDDDAILTRLCGLGRDIRTFKKHREGALRGFVLCSDGRLYHPLIAEDANKAWEGKLQQRWKTECARIRQHNKRHNANILTPTYEAYLASGCAKVSLPVTDESRVTDDEQPRDTPFQEKETGTGTDLEGRIPSQDGSGLRVIGGGV